MGVLSQGLLLFCSSLFCSKSLFLKSNHVRFALIALYKRVTVSELLSSLFKKSDVSDLLFCSQKTSDSLKKCVFSPCFWKIFTAFPLFIPNRSRHSSLCHSFLKSDRSNTLLLLFFKSKIFRSFAHKKRAIHLKNQRGNSQPWCILYTVNASGQVWRAQKCIYNFVVSLLVPYVH